MGRFVGKSTAVFVALVACWRLLSELIAEHRRLVASGELARLVDARRARTHERALVRVAVAVDAVGGVGAARRDSTHAAVHVGSIRGGDVDDVGLLEGAMRRATRAAASGASAVAPAPAASIPAAASAARPRVRVRAEAVRPEPLPLPAAPPASPERVSDRDRIFAALAHEEIEEAVETDGDGVPPWAMALAALAAAFSAFVLLHPLGKASVWMALACVALAAAGWLGAHFRDDER